MLTKIVSKTETEKENKEKETKRLIALNEANIRQALEDYGRHTYQQTVLEDISDEFICRLAEDATYAKVKLRELFRKSPAWNENLQALVINGNRTHDPDSDQIHDLAWQILTPYYMEQDDETKQKISQIVRYFELFADIQAISSSTEENEDDHTNNILRNAERKGIDALNTLAPKAYTPGKKPSRIFKALCVALGIADESSGSKFQRVYAKLADELNGRKIDFKLYVSINPAHFLTMSNPKGDQRGSTLVSCHSLNATDYDYNNGCAGYARDHVTFIVFTVDNPENPESLNNRKTTRQLFMYKPYNGLLLQSRMYNTSGGVSGAAEETRTYRNLVEREICYCEDVPNLWKSHKYKYNDNYLFEPDSGFGGYADWTYYNTYDINVAIRNDAVENYERFTIGASGLCVKCGEETERGDGMYCEYCKDNIQAYCDICGDAVTNVDNLYTVHGHDGNDIMVCESCYSQYCCCCKGCEEDYLTDDMYCIDGDYYCSDCASEVGESCDYCGELHLRENMYHAWDRYGDGIFVDEDCVFEYEACPHCGEIIQKCEDNSCPNCGCIIEEENNNNESEVA